MREGRVTANGLEFAYLEQGEGPLLLLLHGFPDNAHTWSNQIPDLAAAGFRVVAPFTRGYAPTQVPGDGGFFDTATLANDARALIGELGRGEPAFVVGHDWGAATTYMLTSAWPDSVKRAVAIALPHPALIAGSFTDPAAIHRAFHFWFFQLEGLPEMAVSANDYAFIDYLWSEWSPGHKDPDHIRSVKDTLAQPGSLAAALGYYRGMINPAKQDPALNDARATFGQPIKVPTMTIIGGHDLIRFANLAAQASLYSAPMKIETVEGTGHFLHREQPEVVTKLILDWLQA